MDMSLPVLDGREATRRLKADEATRPLPFTGLTAHPVGGDRDDHDLRPVDLERVPGKIQALVEKKV